MSFPLSYLIASATNALLGHVASALRAYMVNFDEEEKVLHSYFIYDQEVDDFLFDLDSCASAEIDLGGQYKEPYLIENHFIHLNTAEKIPFQGHLIYLRYEPDLEGHYPNVRYTSLIEETNYLYAYLFLDMQNALLVKVTASLREVLSIIHSEEKIIDLYFFYDGPISELDYHLATLAAKGGNASFPSFSVRTFIERCDFPKRIPSNTEDGRAVYVRYENMNLLTD